MQVVRYLGTALLALAVSSDALAARYQCRSKNGDVRNVLVDGKMMTVVNPKTPNIVFTKRSEAETRGDITRTTNDAWEMFEKQGMGKLTNKTFGDEYACLQTGT